MCYRSQVMQENKAHRLSIITIQRIFEALPIPSTVHGERGSARFVYINPCFRDSTAQLTLLCQDDESSLISQKDLLGILSVKNHDAQEWPHDFCLVIAGSCTKHPSSMPQGICPIL